MKIFKTSQIASIDRYTIEHEPISDIELMERAALKVADFIVNHENYWGKVAVFCGPGNNGGDGLAVARLLARHGQRFRIMVYILKNGRDLSPSALINFQRLSEFDSIACQIIDQGELPHPDSGTLVIDALFGSGLTRPLSGRPAEVVSQINQSGCRVLSIDIPSGLMGENNTLNVAEAIIRAEKTITFQFPKLSFLLPENEIYVGQWYVVPIGLHPEVIDETPTGFYFVDRTLATEKVHPRARFSHKGHFGHALLIAGSYGKMGAALLSAKACLRSGVGLLTVHLPHKTYPIMQSALPESMAEIDESDLMFTSVNQLETYSAVGIGPAIGLKVNTQRGLRQLIDTVKVPLVIDADGITILSKNPDWMTLLPPYTVITPHPGEFDRLAGLSDNGFDRLQKAIQLAEKYCLIVVLKGAFTATILPNGEVFFNSTGNPGLATAGSGDTLTGIILGLLAQKYSPADAAILGVYLHGLAGDMAASVHGENGLIASDIIEYLGKAFIRLLSVERFNLAEESFFTSLYDVKENGFPE